MQNAQGNISGKHSSPEEGNELAWAKLGKAGQQLCSRAIEVERISARQISIICWRASLTIVSFFDVLASNLPSHRLLAPQRQQVYLAAAGCICMCICKFEFADCSLNALCDSSIWKIGKLTIEKHRCVTDTGSANKECALYFDSIVLPRRSAGLTLGWVH